MKFILSTFSLIDGAFGAISKRSLPYLRSSRFSSMLSSRNLIYTFVFHIYLCDSFVEGVEFVSRFICLPMDALLFQIHLLRRPYFLHCIAFATCSKISWPCLCFACFFKSHRPFSNPFLIISTSHLLLSLPYYHPYYHSLTCIRLVVQLISNIYYKVSSTEVTISCSLSHSILTKTLWGRQYYDPLPFCKVWGPEILNKFLWPQY